MCLRKLLATGVGSVSRDFRGDGGSASNGNCTLPLLQHICSDLPDHLRAVQYWQTLSIRPILAHKSGGLGPTSRHLEIKMSNDSAVCDAAGMSVFLQFAPPVPPGFFAQPWPQVLFAEPSPPGFFAQLLLRELFAEPSLRGLFAEPLHRGLFAEPSLRGLFAEPLHRGLFVEPSLRGLFAEPLPQVLFAQISPRGSFGYVYVFHAVLKHFVPCQTWTAPLTCLRKATIVASN